MAHVTSARKNGSCGTNVGVAETELITAVRIYALLVRAAKIVVYLDHKNTTADDVPVAVSH